LAYTGTLAHSQKRRLVYESFLRINEVNIFRWIPYDLLPNRVPLVQVRHLRTRSQNEFVVAQ